MPRGGARPNSGRKPRPERARLDVRVSAEVRAQVEADAARTGEGVSEWIRQAVLERLERRRGMDLRASVSGTFDKDEIRRLGWPVAWQGTVGAEERKRQKDDLNALVEEALEAFDTNPDVVAVEIEAGEIKSVIVS